VIVVAGGAGRLGTLVVRGLAGRGLAMRVLTRDATRAAHLDGVAAEIVEADVRDPAGLRAALAGADTVVSAVQGFAGPGHVSPRTVDLEGNRNLIHAAAASEPRPDLILVSVIGASADSPMVLFRCKYAAEQALRESGLSWTIVRSAAFVELWAEIVGTGVVLGRGDTPVGFVSVRDVAAVVERAVLDKGTRGHVLEVAGENLTFNQLAELESEVRGKPERVRHIPRAALRVMAPLNRQARAALTIDTIDMTTTPPGERVVLERRTTIREALAGASAAAP
jgi:NADH dehydrogenase